MKKVYSKNKPTCKVTFSLPKEAVQDANSVAVLGDFNDWNESHPLALEKSKDGSFKKTMELEVGKTYEFRYLIDNDRWENDWNADDYVASKFIQDVHNSVVSLTNGQGIALKNDSVSTLLETIEKEANEIPVGSTETKVVVERKVKKAAKKKVAKKSTKEDLKKIEGIGPKIAALLSENGIASFKDLGKASKKKLTTILENAGGRYKIHDPSTWAEQAKLAAKGKWDELKELQNELKGGKRV